MADLVDFAAKVDVFRYIAGVANPLQDNLLCRVTNYLSRILQDSSPEGLEDSRINRLAPPSWSLKLTPPSLPGIVEAFESFPKPPNGRKQHMKDYREILKITFLGRKGDAIIMKIYK